MSDISVLSRSQVIVVDPATHAVAIINAGPPGAGGGGGGGGTGVTDGNKGDISVYDSGLTWLINPGVVTESMLSFDPATQGELDTLIATIGTTYAPIASPGLTGVPTAPTAAEHDNSTQIATTAYVDRFPKIVTHDMINYPVNTVGNLTVIDLSYAAAGGGSGSGAFTDAAFVLSDDADSLRKMVFSVGGITSGMTRTYTAPDESGTLVLTTAAQMLDNKHISVPTIHGAVYLDGFDYDGTVTSRIDTGVGLFADLYRYGQVTLDYSGAGKKSVIRDDQTIIFAQPGATLSSYTFAYASAFLKNDAAGTSVGLGGGRTYTDTTHITADTDSIAIGAWQSYRAAMMFAVASTGLVSSGTYTGFAYSPDTKLGVTMATLTGFATSFVSGTNEIKGLHTTFNHFKVNDPIATTYNPGVAGIQTQYGIDIVALAAAGTNVGIRNLSTLRQVGAAVFGSDAAAASNYGLEVKSNAFGYGVGTGDVVTQGTSKTTAVTINKPNGYITTHNESIANNVGVTFVVNNSFVAAGDTVIVNHVSGGTLPNGNSSAGGNNGYNVSANTIGAGVFSISIRNITGSTVGEALTIKFTVIKGATT